MFTAVCLIAASAVSTARPTVAVLPPVPSTAKDAWVGLMLADSVTERLLVHSRYDPNTLQRLYPINVFGWHQTMNVAWEEGIDPTRPIKKGRQLRVLLRRLGADYLFGGTYTIKGGNVVLSWRLYDHPKQTTEKTTLKLANLNQGVEVMSRQILVAADQNLKALEGHRLKALPLSAVRPFGECLAILSRQSLDPLARLILPRRQLAEAHLRAHAATDAAPQFVHAWAARGIVSTMMGRLEAAEMELAQALAQAGEAEPFVALALYFLHQRRGQEAEGIKILEETTSSHLGYLLGLGYLGVAYARSGASHKALEVFSQYHARAPKNPWARVMRARVLSRTGNHDLAIRETRAVAKAFPDSPMVLAAFAARQLDAKKYAEARKTLESAIRTHPGHPVLLTRLSYVEIENGSLEKALALAQQAVAALAQGRGESQAGNAHLTLGHAQALLGKVSGAYGSMRKAVELGVSSEARHMLVRDVRLKQILQDSRSPIQYKEFKD